MQTQDSERRPDLRKLDCNPPLRLRWPHVLFARDHLIHAHCPGFIINNILFILRRVVVWTINFMSPSLRLLSLTEPQTRYTGICMYVCICVYIYPNTTNRAAETRLWQNRHSLHFQELLSAIWDFNLRMIHRNNFPNNRITLILYLMCCFVVGKPESDNFWKRVFPLPSVFLRFC